MSERTCPQCGEPVDDGVFCAQCGASLEARACPSCGEESPPGTRFCTSCGSSLSGAGVAAGGGKGGGDGAMGWWVAGLVLVALILFLLVPVLSPDRGLVGPDGTTGVPATGQTSPSGGALPDLTQMTPREAADRLFDRVVRAGEMGDTAEVVQFLPMALGAYERARPLDLDGLFHLSVLQRTAGEHEAALATAEDGLASAPDHLLLLAAAAEAARELDRAEVVREHYTHLLDVWDEERASGRPEYQDHSPLLPQIQADAAQYLRGG